MRDLVLLQIGVVAVMVALRRAGAARPAAIPSVPVALRPLVWWIVGGNALIYGVLSLRALRTFQLTRRLGDLAVAAGLVWLAIAVATYLLSPLWSVGFWSRARARAGCVPGRHGGARERSRPRDARRARCARRSTSATS